MKFSGILKIQFCRVVKDFKLNPLDFKKKDSVQIQKILRV
jgi:hypothetical protein